MLMFAGAAIVLGWVRQDEAGSVNLRPWLTLAIIGGASASALAGLVSQHIARRYRGPVVLGFIVLGIGVLEAAGILRQAASGGTVAQAWLVLMAPIVAASGVLCGG
jgi:hypothetical protein